MDHPANPPERQQARRRRREGSGAGTLVEMARVALAIPAPAPDWPSQCSYYELRSRRAGLLLSVILDLDTADQGAVNRAAEALWDALEHCPVTYDRVAAP